MLRIARLADHPEAIAALAAGYWREWPDWYRDLEQARTDLDARRNRTRLPLALVAFEDAPVGTLAISDLDTYGDPDFRPTVIGLWVAKAHRHRGIATALLRAACGEARALGFSRLHATTASVAPLFLRTGWSSRGEAEWRGERLQLFVRAL